MQSNFEGLIQRTREIHYSAPPEAAWWYLSNATEAASRRAKWLEAVDYIIAD